MENHTMFPPPQETPSFSFFSILYKTDKTEKLQNLVKYRKLSLKIILRIFLNF